jgi:Fe-S-cluster containining protein
MLSGGTPLNKINLPRKLKLPSPVLEFRCAQCGECCTNKWKIEVDTVSYEKLYQKFAELGRQKELHDNIQYHDVAPQIRFLPNGKCPYLAADNRCSIQLEIGEEYLLDICKVYPRRIFASQHAIEFALSLTCRTAIKTLLKEQIHIIETDWPIKNGQDVFFSSCSLMLSPDTFPIRSFGATSDCRTMYWKNALSNCSKTADTR